MLRMLLAVALLVISIPALADSKRPESKPAAPQAAMPSDRQILALMTSTLLALNQANLTGNYSVFRELGAPGFQLVNSSAKLANIFAKLRSKGFDLAPIVVLTPKLAAPAAIKDGMLRVSGFFPTQPERLVFDLIYQPVGGRWLLFGLAVDTAPDEPAIASGKAQGQALPPAPQEQTPQAATKPQASQVLKAPPKAKPQAEAAPGADVRDRVHEIEAAEAQPAPPKPKASPDPFGAFR